MKKQSADTANKNRPSSIDDDGQQKKPPVTSRTSEKSETSRISMAPANENETESPLESSSKKEAAKGATRTPPPPPPPPPPPAEINGISDPNQKKRRSREQARSSRRRRAGAASRNHNDNIESESEDDVLIGSFAVNGPGANQNDNNQVYQSDDEDQQALQHHEPSTDDTMPVALPAEIIPETRDLVSAIATEKLADEEDSKDSAKQITISKRTLWIAGCILLAIIAGGAIAAGVVLSNENDPDETRNNDLVTVNENRQSPTDPFNDPTPPPTSVSGGPNGQQPEATDMPSTRPSSSPSQSPTATTLEEVCSCQVYRQTIFISNRNDLVTLSDTRLAYMRGVFYGLTNRYDPYPFQRRHLHGSMMIDMDTSGQEEGQTQERQRLLPEVPYQGTKVNMYIDRQELIDPTNSRLLLRSRKLDEETGDDMGIELRYFMTYCSYSLDEFQILEYHDAFVNWMSDQNNRFGVTEQLIEEVGIASATNMSPSVLAEEAECWTN